MPKVKFSAPCLRTYEHVKLIGQPVCTALRISSKPGSSGEVGPGNLESSGSQRNTAMTADCSKYVLHLPTELSHYPIMLYSLRYTTIP